MGRVVHCRRSTFDLYIGRAFGGFRESIWSNPFHIGKDGSRLEVIDKYKIRTRNDARLMSLIPTLTGLTLGCWCHPQPCHGDVLLELVRKYWERTRGCRFRLIGSVYVAEAQLDLGFSQRPCAELAIGKEILDNDR
jgi:hypothetical protein